MADIICRVTDEKTLGVWPLQEHVSVTLTLLETAPDVFAVNYEAAYSGIIGGQVAGGPVPVSGNGSHVVNQDPKVTVIVSNWTDDKVKHTITLHVTITVDVPVIGSKVIFDKDLGGKYGENKLAAIVAHIAEIAKAA